MPRLNRALLPFLLLVCLVGHAFANGFEADKVPAIGSIAPAFGLYSLGGSADQSDADEVLQLDSVCGLRPGTTKGVLLLFIEQAQLADLELANQWHRRFSRQGLKVLAISVDPRAGEVSSKVAKERLRFPVLDDQHRIVAHRYGITEAPFSMLLNSECRVLGFSNKSLTEEEEALVASIEALIDGQIGKPSGSMDD